MSSPREVRTFSTANPNQAGATIQNPLLSIGVQIKPTAEQFYVLDRAQGFIQVIAREAQDYREMGFPILDGYGNRVTDFDAAHQAAVAQYTEPDQAASFYSQYDHIWELFEMEQAMAEAGADESVHYSKLSRSKLKSNDANTRERLHYRPLVQEEEGCGQAP